VHFTGSTEVFNSIWKTAAAHIGRYRSYPRIVGETGGKNFVVIHPSADPQAAATAIARGGYEYQGQKCSAVGRVYAPRSLWPDVRDRLIGMIDSMLVGDVSDFRTFAGAVIDARACTRIGGYLDDASATANVLAGGGVDIRHGWFVQPTLVETDNPQHRLMREEVFGPVVTAYVYQDRQFPEVLELIDRTSAYALTGSVFAQDRGAIGMAADRLRNAAGNFYVNDKPTGSLVGQQPFGGMRASGTNDQVGSKHSLLRWVSARSIKETFAPAVDVMYPSMAEE